MLETRIGCARVWCTGRSQGNLGDHVGDDPEVVARNRARVRALVAAEDAGPEDNSRWVWLRQVHGVNVHVAHAPAPGSSGEIGPVIVADATVTAEPRLALAIVTADCAPLVVANDDAVGVVHAGHRGCYDGVIEATIAALRNIGTGPVRAFLGPCIRPASYEFGAADLARFVSRFGPSVEGRTRAGHPALDIPAAIAAILERAGVDEFQDCGVCTADSPEYFSYRRAQDTGRQATIAVVA
jgi:YfiH family protein